MKMKTGPKVVLLALIFVGLGYWAGRGFPRTWQEVLHPHAAAASVAAPDEGQAARITDLENRVSTLEKDYTDLQSRLNASAPAGSAATPSAESPAPPPVPAPEAGPGPQGSSAQSPGAQTPGAPDFNTGM